MAESVDPLSLTISALCYRCARESENFFQRKAHDPRFCFELYRRAAIQRVQEAWDCLYKQYQPLVASWVERHSLFHSSGEERDFFVNWAFEKMWTILTPEKFANFPDLKSILRYLQMCVHSVLVDFMRAREKAVLFENEPVGMVDPAAPEVEAPEQVTLDRMAIDEFWLMLSAKLKNEKEQRVIYGSFVLALKPSELIAQYPRVFENVKEVYQVKENVLARLGRDAEVLDFLGNL
jgi:hypothetical protein